MRQEEVLDYVADTWPSPFTSHSSTPCQQSASSGMRSSWPPLGINCDPVSKGGVKQLFPRCNTQRRKHTSSVGPWL